MKESRFQTELIRDLNHIFPGCVIMKNDSSYIQGIPDLIILFENQWAALECKSGLYSTHQPNQDYYVEKLNEMSFATFICPENKEEVLDDLQQTFRPRR